MRVWLPCCNAAMPPGLMNLQGMHKGIQQYLVGRPGRPGPGQHVPLLARIGRAQSSWRVPVRRILEAA